MKFVVTAIASMAICYAGLCLAEAAKLSVGLSYDIGLFVGILNMSVLRLIRE